jgi:CHAD domain-containing protein
LRELLPVLQLKQATAAKLNRRLRKVTARLGAVRDLDVLLLMIDELHASRRARSAGLARIGIAVAHERTDARKRLDRHGPIKEMRRVAAKLDGIADQLAAGDASRPASQIRSCRWAIDARIVRRALHLTSALHASGAVYVPERLHAVRIAVKKLRYALELSTGARDARRAAETRLLKRGQDILGRMHDLRLHGRYMRARDTLSAVAETLSLRAAALARTHTTRRVG